ncbi:MAG: alcohol dehydrogenase catalytic domain-containing protein [Candidatus Rokubacteria bacterium]|nr:alcohol dehydrogenase catalytic domain-containing protein [Candidatus Rokubacteria bacterium]
MKAVVLREGGRLHVEDWPRPSAGPGELLLRLRGCGLCGSDIAKVAAPLPGPALVLGHELVGDVVQAGAGVERFRVGERVVAAHHVPCGRCHYCRRGSASMCREFKTSNLDPGGFAEYVRVPAANVEHATFRIPAHVDDETASFVEPLACCLRAVRRAPVEAGDTVVVIGLGSIGCLFVQLARRAGARVAGVDPLPERAALARQLGAAAAGAPESVADRVAELSERRGADQVIVTGGGADVLPWAAARVRDGGTIHYFAGGGGSVLPLALAELYHRELTLTSTYSSSPADLADAFRMIVAGDVAVAPLVSQRVGLDGLAEALDRMRRRETLKVFVTP